MIRLLVGFLILVAHGRLDAQARHEFTELHMGVAVRIALYAPDQATARSAARAAFDRIAQLEDIFSDYRSGSELRRLELRAGHWTPVSAELLTVLSLARRVAEASDGAFDPTVAPLVLLWRESRRSGRLPEQVVLDSARALVNWRHLEVDTLRGTIRLTRPDMRLDLGGVAKGSILRWALATLRSRGIRSAFIEAGGDLALGESPPGQLGWDIAVAGMVPGPRFSIAVATSGPAEQFIEINGIRYAHIVDPRTGLGSTTGFQATVIGPDGGVADALATALAILGSEGQQRLLADFPGYRAVIVVPDAADPLERKAGTPGLAPSGWLPIWSTRELGRITRAIC